MSKHTKGPWTGGMECINAPDGRLIAEVVFYNEPDRSVMTHEIFVANSNLIAAAPEMFDVLKRLFTSISKDPRTDFRDIETLQKVIAKAEGKEP